MYKFIHKFLFLFFILNLSSFSYAENKIGYIDLDFILAQSNASKSLFKQLNEIETSNFNEFEIKEKKLKDDQNKVLSTKNILSKDEYNIRVNIFKKDLNEYNTKKSEIINNLKIKRKNEIIRFVKLISPLINEFMDKNSIGILIEKKNIFIAKSNYDITENILEIINNEIKEFKILNDN